RTDAEAHPQLFAADPRGMRADAGASRHGRDGAHPRDVDAALRRRCDFGGDLFGSDRPRHGSGVHGRRRAGAGRTAVLEHGAVDHELWWATHSFRDPHRTEARWLKAARYPATGAIAFVRATIRTERPSPAVCAAFMDAPRPMVQWRST